MNAPQPILMSIQVAQAALHSRTAPDGTQHVYQSGIDKIAVAGHVAAERTGLAGDAQADRKNHGGIDKAVLAYAAAHYPTGGETCHSTIGGSAASART